MGHRPGQRQRDEKTLRRLRRTVRIDHPGRFRRQGIRERHADQFRSGRPAKNAGLPAPDERSGPRNELRHPEHVDGAGRLRLPADHRLRPETGVAERRNRPAGQRVPDAEVRAGIQAQRAAQFFVSRPHERHDPGGQRDRMSERRRHDRHRTRIRSRRKRSRSGPATCCSTCISTTTTAHGTTI